MFSTVMPNTASSWDEPTTLLRCAPVHAGYTGAACDTLVPTVMANHKSPIGVEVAGLAYWSTQWVFLDIMKQSSAWMTQNAPDT